MLRFLPLKNPSFLLRMILLSGVLMLSTAACEQEEPIVGSIRVEKGTPLETQTRITPDQAQAAALARYPDATVEETELENEDGYLVYAIDLEREGDEIEVTVDAGTGTILRAEDEEAEEDRNDEGKDDDEGDENEEEGEENEEGAVLPEAVAAAFRRAYPTAQILATGTEHEGEASFFEIESQDGAVRRDVLYRPDGTLYESEEVVAPETLPDVIRQAGQAQGQILEAERITRGATVEYELVVTNAGVRRALLFDAAGQLIGTANQEEE